MSRQSYVTVNSVRTTSSQVSGSGFSGFRSHRQPQHRRATYESASKENIAARTWLSVRSEELQQFMQEPDEMTV